MVARLSHEPGKRRSIKLLEYAREVALVWSKGVALSDKLRLANATLTFHLSNVSRATRKSAARRYRVNLTGQPQDLWLRTLGGDIFVLHEVFGSGCYHPPYDLSPLRTIIDLGANIGLTTLYLASIAPKARFICVEPVPGNVELLRRNVCHLSRVVVIEAAVAGSSGRIAIDDTRPSWGATITSDGRLRVRAISIDDLLKNYAPTGMIDLLKMDIEGAEAGVLSGAMRWLNRVRCIVAELHPPFTLEQFESLMIARGFDIVPNQMMPTAIRRTCAG